MPTTRLQDKLSTLVGRQLPEYIQSDYPTFVAFLEAYYKFLEQDQGAQELLQNARNYNDIDLTIDSFIDNFRKQYVSELPDTITADKKLLVKRIKDLYNNKGNEKGFQLLFRLLFNKTAEIFYPSTQILKASDGKWSQRSSIFVQTVFGDPGALVDKFTVVKSVNNNTQYYLQVEEIDTCRTAIGISDNTFEMFINNKTNVPIEVGDTIEYVDYKGIVVGVPARVTVVTGGTGFRVGDIFTLESGNGNAARIKVTQISTGGTITKVQLISFGIGYVNNFYNFFTSSTLTAASTRFTYASGIASISDNTSGFIGRGTITTQGDYAVTNYFGEDYTGILLREFFSSTVVNATGINALGTSSDASIFVELGPVVRYPGHYITTDGFLSDDMYLEDESYYQPYTYVVRIDERLDSYRKALIDLVHPAGTRLYGEYTVENSFNIGTDVEATISFLRSLFTDTYTTSDADSKDISKNVSDELETDSENIVKNIAKALTNTFESIDSLAFVIESPYTELIDIVDDISIAYELNLSTEGIIEPYALSGYFAEEYTIISDNEDYFVVNDDDIALV